MQHTSGDSRLQLRYIPPQKGKQKFYVTYPLQANTPTSYKRNLAHPHQLLLVNYLPRSLGYVEFDDSTGCTPFNQYLAGFGSEMSRYYSTLTNYIYNYNMIKCVENLESVLEISWNTNEYEYDLKIASPLLEDEFSKGPKHN